MGRPAVRAAVRMRPWLWLPSCGLPCLGRLPIGDLDQDVGVVEHAVACAAKEAVLARSRCRGQAFEHTLELPPPTWLGPQFDNRLDGHLVLPSCPSARLPCSSASICRPDDGANRPAGD